MVGKGGQDREQKKGSKSSAHDTGRGASLLTPPVPSLKAWLLFTGSTEESVKRSLSSSPPGHKLQHHSG